MADLDLQAVHDELVSVAYEAGSMILAANPAELDTDTKLNCMSFILCLVADSTKTSMQPSTSSLRRTRGSKRWFRPVYHPPSLTFPSWARKHISLA